MAEEKSEPSGSALPPATPLESEKTQDVPDANTNADKKKNARRERTATFKDYIVCVLTLSTTRVTMLIASSASSVMLASGIPLLTPRASSPPLARVSPCP